MTVIIPDGYVLPVGDEPTTHARIGHANNWLTGGTVSASGTDSDYDADAPDNSLTYEKWKPDALPATWEYDHGTTAECDYCGIAAHTLGTNGNTLQVQYHDGSIWQDTITATPILTDEPIMVAWEPETRQRWRIRISGGTAPTIGVIKFGKAMQMQRALFGGHAPINTARQAVLKGNNSSTGEYLGRSVIRTMNATSYEWSHLTTEWVRDNWLDFQKAIETDPFFIAWRPADNGDVAYAVVDSLPVPQNMGIRDLMSVSMSVRARGYD